VVGAHNALLTYGKKFDLFHLQPAYACKDMEDMVTQYHDIKIPPIKIVVTGDGRVAHGIVHIMNAMNIMEVSPSEFLNGTFEHPVYTRLYNESLYLHKQHHTFEREDFHNNPQNYNCLFAPYLVADILINGIYWDAAIPRLFERSDVHKETFNISVIADVTCDEDGSVPINLGASTIADPVYGYNKSAESKTAPFQNDPNIIDIMAVDNLPNELPRDASKIFGESIINAVMPELLKPKSEILERATICRDGKLGAHFEYLHDYAFPNEMV
jgi:saccharopine dehydrogenase (NAD+, L-lysine-forming)